MYFLLIFGFGLLFSFLGALPLGVINLTVVDLSINKSFKSAGILAFSASLIQVLQAYFAILFSEFLFQSPEIQKAIELFVIPLFFILALIYWFRKSIQRNKNAKILKINPFIKGLLLGILNPLGILFWLFYVSYLNSLSCFDLSSSSKIFVFNSAIFLGNFLALLFYALLGFYVFKNIEKLRLWMNKIIATVFFILGFYQLLRLWILN